MSVTLFIKRKKSTLSSIAYYVPSFLGTAHGRSRRYVACKKDFSNTLWSAACGQQREPVSPCAALEGPYRQLRNLYHTTERGGFQA